MKMVPLGEISEPISNDRGETEGPVLSITKHEGFVRSADYFKKVVHSKDLSKYKRVQPGNFAFSPIHLDEGSIALADEEGLISPMYRVFKAQEDLVDKNYLIRILKADPMIALYGTLGDGSVHRRRSVPWNRLSKVEIPLPPLEEQKRIAGILDQADALRRLRTRALDTLNTLGQAIFHEMFGNAVTITQAVGELGDVQGGLQVTKKRDVFERRAPYLRVANVYRDRLTLEEIKTIGLTNAEAERTMLRSGDVLIVEGHGNPSEIGRTAVWSEEISGCVHQNHLIRFRPDQTQVLPQFFSSYMNSAIGRKHLASSSRTTTGLNTISTKKVKECVVPVPSINSQRDYLARYETIQRQVTNFKSLEIRQDALFASLQHRAFRGDL